MASNPVSTSEVSISHPDLTEKLQEYVEPPKKTPQVERLESHVGFFERAQRLLWCHRMGRYRKCKKGHIKKDIFSCGLRFCPDCALELAEQYFKRAFPIAKSIMRKCIADKSKVVELFLSVPCERNQPAMEKLIAYVTARLRSAKITCPIYLHFSGFQYKDGCDRAILTVLLGGTGWYDWKLVFKGLEGEVEFNSHSQSHFTTVLRHMMEPLRHLCPIELADHEVLFEGFHMRRAYNMPELSVEELNATENSPHKGCSECGEPWVAVSEPFSLHACGHLPDPKIVRWNDTDSPG
jgi:hypothetical protein